jgi:hypothetical protein
VQWQGWVKHVNAVHDISEWQAEVRELGNSIVGCIEKLDELQKRVGLVEERVIALEAPDYD